MATCRKIEGTEGRSCCLVCDECVHKGSGSDAQTQTHHDHEYCKNRSPTTNTLHNYSITSSNSTPLQIKFTESLLSNTPSDEILCKLTDARVQLRSIWQRDNEVGQKQLQARPKHNDIISLWQKSKDSIHTQMASLQERCKEAADNVDQIRKHGHCTPIKSQKGFDEMVNHPPQEILKLFEYCEKYNLNLCAERIAYSSKMVVAYEILEFVHDRLSRHLANHVAETTERLSDESAKASYLKLFGRDGPLATKSIAELTYLQLLNYVDAHHAPREEFRRALKSSEKALLLEAAKEGYNPSLLGDINWQISILEILEKRFSSKYCHVDDPLLGTQLTQNLIDHVRQDAENGHLGILQRSSQLIRLGCFSLARLSSPPNLQNIIQNDHR